jgi:hypothetical protein
MRHLAGLLPCLALLAFAAGCHHVAGVCDCLDHGCGGHCAGHMDTMPVIPTEYGYGRPMAPVGEQLGTPRSKDNTSDKDKGSDKDKSSDKDKGPDKDKAPEMDKVTDQ